MTESLSLFSSNASPYQLVIRYSIPIIFVPEKVMHRLDYTWPYIIPAASTFRVFEIAVIRG